jgi:ribonuclease HI
LFFDGTASPNPGRMGIGCLLLAPDGSEHRLSRALPGSGCNNEAEGSALLAGLQLAASLGAENLTVAGDSRALIDYLQPGAPATVPRLQTLLDQLQAALSGFAAYHCCWVPRHHNQAADALARQALGLVVKPAGRPISRKRRR